MGLMSRKHSESNLDQLASNEANGDGMQLALTDLVVHPTHELGLHLGWCGWGPAMLAASLAPASRSREPAASPPWCDNLRDKR